MLRQLLVGALIGFMVGSLVARLLGPSESSRPGAREVEVLILAMLLVVLRIHPGRKPVIGCLHQAFPVGNGDDQSAVELQVSLGSYGKLAELVLFLSMGLVVEPLQVLVLLPWIVLLAVLMLLVRFVVVFLLLGNNYDGPKTVCWLCGLRGAVPIALAIQAAAHPQMGRFGVSGCLHCPRRGAARPVGPGLSYAIGTPSGWWNRARVPSAITD